MFQPYFREIYESVKANKILDQLEKQMGQPSKWAAKKSLATP
jgi:hypothetical protein